MWNDVKHQEIPEDTTVLSLLLRSRFYIQGIVGIRSLYDTMQVPFHCRTFPDCEPRNYIPGIRWNSSKCKGCDGNLYWFTMSIITCYFSEVAKIFHGYQPTLERSQIWPKQSPHGHSTIARNAHHSLPFIPMPTRATAATIPRVLTSQKPSSSIGKWWSFLIGGVFEDERSFSIDLDVIYASTSMFHFKIWFIWYYWIRYI